MRNLARRTWLTVAALMGALAACIATLLWLESVGRISADLSAWLSLAAVLAAGIAAVALVRHAAARAAAPLQELATALNRTAGGDFETDLALPDELELQSAFDSVRSSLRSSELSRDRLDRLLSSMSEGILVSAPDGTIERANGAAHEMLGYEAHALVGRPISEILSRPDGEALKATPRMVPQETSFRKADGSHLSVSYTVSEMRSASGELECTVYAVQNIEARKKVEQRIRYLARVDPLTKLANRMQFQHVLQQTIARARRSQQYVALLYLDVDRFKDI
ncbi:MAG: PAS domain S-box protein, partial [Gammaproteobacteria bacterium]|nr:PAS domain S-box protein [Gammaproteobacteria bacterium]